MMPGHEIFEELITEKLDGVISADGEKALSDHLASCPECREMYELLSGAHAALEFEVEPPVELVPRVMEALREQKNRARARRRRVLAGTLAAAAVAAVAILPAALRDRDGGHFIPASYTKNGGDPSTVTVPTELSPCYNPSGTPLPLEDTPSLYLSVENWCADYAAVAWFDALPEEITETATKYPFADGSVGYAVTEEQFNSLLDAALRVSYPDPDGTQYMAVLPAE